MKKVAWQKPTTAPPKRRGRWNDAG